MAESDIAELRKQCIMSLYLCTENISKYLETDKENEFSKLKTYVEDYCLLEAQEEVAIQALEKAKRETDTSNIESLHERFNSYLNNMAAKRLNVGNHPYMLEFKKRIKKGLQSKENLDESDLAITASQDRYIDPITKKPIEDPVKNVICGHIYEKEVIYNQIHIKNKTRCPVAGCGNREPIQKQNLISDDELKFRMTVTQNSTMIQERSVLDLDVTME